MRSSSVYKKPTRFSPTRRSAASSIRLILSLWSSKRISLPRLNSPRYGFYEFGGDFFPSFGCATDFCLDYRTRTLTSLKNSRQCLSSTRDSPRPSLSLVSATLIRPRRRWRDFMISGTTLTVGEVSSGWIRRLTRVAIGMRFVILTSMCLIPTPAITAAMINDIPRRKINPSERAERRKISPNSEVSLI